jgi:integrase
MAMAGKAVKLAIGTVYQKESQGNYFFRYQVNGKRQAVCLKTKNQKEAIAQAEELIPLVKAPTAEILSEHVKHAKGWGAKVRGLELGKVWDVYAKHPDRATPATVNEQEAYKATFQEFLNFVGKPSLGINEVTPGLVGEYADDMRKQDIAVDTHNRKLRRLQRIFDTMKEFRTDDNPFTVRSFKRKEREEQGSGVRRKSFTREEEERIRQVLDDDKHRVMHKPEMRVIYYLGMFTGQRFKDCVLLQWDSVNLDQQQIRVKQYKTGKEVTIPISPKLLPVLLEAKKWPRLDQYVCPKVAERYKGKDKKGKDTGNNLVNIDALRVIRWIGLEPSVTVPGRKKKVTVYGFHSLRHSFVSCDAAQRKAIDAISFGNTTTVSPQAKIDKVLAWIDGLKTKNGAVKTIESMLR